MVWRDAVLYKLEEGGWQEFFTQVISASVDGHSPHHWVELVDKDGRRWVWDGSRGSKLGGETMVLFEKAKKMWPDFDHKGVDRIVLLGEEEG